MKKTVVHFDLSDGKYIECNGLKKDSPKFRVIEYELDGETKNTMVDVTTYPEHLLPGGPGATKEEKSARANKPAKKAAKKAAKKTSKRK